MVEAFGALKLLDHCAGIGAPDAALIVASFGTGAFEVVAFNDGGRDHKGIYALGADGLPKDASPSV